jgi:hypothetical protein
MKKIISIIFIVSFVITGLIISPPNKAYACSCAVGNTAEKLERSSAVFEGKVIDKGGTIKVEHNRLRKYTFEVERAWKGVNKKRITIYSYDGDSASCGFEFNKNETYLVYSYLGDDELLQTNLCSGNLPISLAKDEIAQLGEGTKISIVSDDDPNERSSSLHNIDKIVGAILLVLLLHLVIIWIIKRRKR